MGDIIGGVIGGIGSLVGGNSAAQAENEAAQSALTGYNYLNTNPTLQASQNSYIPDQVAQGAAQSQQVNQLDNANNVTSAEQGLLTGTATPGQNQAYQNYLSSTGYQFQQQQGTDAITGSAAAKGLLNSGATAKALTSYGQGLAGQSFNNYLGQLASTAGQSNTNAAGYGTLADQYTTQTGQALSAADAIGQAGTTGGTASGQFQAQAGQSVGTSQAQAANYLGGGVQATFPTFNPFGG